MLFILIAAIIHILTYYLVDFYLSVERRHFNKSIEDVGINSKFITHCEFYHIMSIVFSSLFNDSIYILAYCNVLIMKFYGGWGIYEGLIAYPLLLLVIFY